MQPNFDHDNKDASIPHNIKPDITPLPQSTKIEEAASNPNEPYNQSPLTRLQIQPDANESSAVQPATDITPTVASQTIASLSPQIIEPDSVPTSQPATTQNTGLNSDYTQPAAQIYTPNPTVAQATGSVAPPVTVNPIYAQQQTPTVVLPNLQPQQNAIPIKKRSKGKIFAILVAVSLLLGISGAAAFYIYWTSSGQVYKRFQSNLASVIQETIRTESSFMTDVSYKLTVDATNNKNSTLKAESGGRSQMNGFDSDTNVTYKDATLNIGFRTLADTSEAPYMIYFKLKGIEPMLKAVYGNSKTPSIIPSRIGNFDNKWISFDPSSLFNSLSYEQTTNNTTLTSEDIMIIVNALEPMIVESLIGKNNDTNVIRSSNPRKETINSKSTWAYDMSINKPAFNTMIDKLLSHTDQIQITDAKKKTFKSYLESVKFQKTDETYSSQIAFRSDTKTTIWLDTLTSLPIQLKIAGETFNNNKSISSDETIFSITSLTPKNISAKIKFTNKTSLAITNGDITFALNNSTKTVTGNGTLNVKENASAAENKITLNYKLEPSPDKTPIQPPENAIPLDLLINELYGTPRQ